MKNKKKITIIVPVYNAEQYLERCLKSVINQTYRNLEIILIDDGSTDNSGKMCDKWMEKDDRIKVFHKKNGGVSSARNKGIDIATGEYVFFLDSDDEIEKNIIEHLANICFENDVDLVVGNYIENYENGMSKEIHNIQEDKILSNNEFCNIANRINLFIGNKFWKLSIIKENKICFIDIRLTEDINFFFKYMLFAKNVYVTDKYIFNYNITSDSGSRTYDNRILEVFESFENIENSYEKCIKSKEYLKMLARTKLICYNFLLSNIVKCENKYDKKKILKEYFYKIRDSKELNKISENEVFIEYLKIKIKKMFWPLYYCAKKITFKRGRRKIDE